MKDHFYSFDKPNKVTVLVYHYYSEFNKNNATDVSIHVDVNDGKGLVHILYLNNAMILNILAWLRPTKA